MCTSAPDPGQQYHYFADYEAWTDGMPIAWGQVTLTYQTQDGGCLDPAEILSQIRSRAALQQGVDALEIRVRSLARL